MLAHDDDSGPGMFSLIADFVVPRDGWYNVKAYTYGHDYTGDYQLFLNCLFFPDENDVCIPWLDPITEGSGVLYGDMRNDRNDYDPGGSGCTNGYSEAGVDVAFRMDLLAGQMVDLTYSTPEFDAAFYIITDCSNPAGTCVIGADAAYDTEVIHWVVTQTGSYWLILDHYGSDTGRGPWTLTYQIAPQATGACCLCQNCVILTQDDCAAQSGAYQGDGTTCDQNPCPPAEGACCVGSVCIIGTGAQCEEMGGTYYGDCSSCEPNPCPPTPIENSTWGRIKVAYR